MIKKIKTHKSKEYLSTDVKRKMLESILPKDNVEEFLVENTREVVLPKEEIEKLALEIIESGSNVIVKVKMAELVVASIRNMSIEEIKTIRNFSEKDPTKYVKFKI